MNEKVVCKECGKEFDSEKALHRHIKVHNMDLAAYYTKFYPRVNKLTQELLPFKDKYSYFNTDFSTRAQMLKWCRLNKGNQEVKEYILRQLKNRIDNKQLKYAPNHLELIINDLPSIDIYKDNFGGYEQACQELGLEPLYNKGIRNEKIFLSLNKKMEQIPILIDTREQKPLCFVNSKEHKLDFGDYTVGGDSYNYTYVDRKSENDFKGTLGTGYNRFRNELARARQFNSFLYIVIEQSLPQLIKNNNYLKSKKRKGASNLKFIFHRMRLLTHEFKNHCQFIFSGSRSNSELLIPNLLYYGQGLWNVDIQYYLDKYDMDTR